MLQSWQIGGSRSLSLDRPRVVGILNLTPDSFYDGGRLSTVEAAVRAAIVARDEGADLLDIGAESTRPGAERIPARVQRDRIVPVLEALRRAQINLPVSIDTTQTLVLEAAIAVSSDVAVVNDVSAGLEDASMFECAAAHGLGVILMHRLVEPGIDSYSDRYVHAPLYQDVVGDVQAFLAERTETAQSAGISREQIVVDPGLGFGKSVDQNLELIRQTGRFSTLGAGVLSALSRKSFVGRIAMERESEPAERLAGTIGLSVAHWMCGARVFRVHDVKEHVQALRGAVSVLGSPIGIERDTM